jgi:hypothetical protein
MYFWRMRSGSAVPATPLTTASGTLCRRRKLFSASLPPASIFATKRPFFHESMFTDCTKEMCTPRLRCTPEHSRQMYVP